MTEIRWALVGCGDIARKRVAPALRDAEGGRLESVSRGRAELAEEFAREFGAARWFADWREQVRDASTDAVYVATPVHLHEEQTVAAAEAGKHVLCEKPMALDGAACRRMIDACGANGVRLGVAYYRRFYPVVRRIRELIDWEEIGRVVTVQVNAFEPFDVRPWEPRGWLLDPERSGGGPMMDFGSHRVDLLLRLVGSEIEESTAYFSRVRYHERAVEDAAVALLRFANGALGTIAIAHAAAEPRDTLSIYGTTGSLHVESLNRGDLRIVGPYGDRLEHHPPHANLHQPLVEDFLQAIAKSREPEIPGSHGLIVQLELDRIHRPVREP